MTSAERNSWIRRGLCATELSGNEVGYPRVREGQDLRDDRVLVADDRRVVGVGRVAGHADRQGG
jgi:predicted RNA-binding protein with PUA domain